MITNIQLHTHTSKSHIYVQKSYAGSFIFFRCTFLYLTGAIWVCSNIETHMGCWSFWFSGIKWKITIDLRRNLRFRVDDMFNGCRLNFHQEKWINKILQQFFIWKFAIFYLEIDISCWVINWYINWWKKSKLFESIFVAHIFSR